MLSQYNFVLLDDNDFVCLLLLYPNLYPSLNLSASVSLVTYVMKVEVKDIWILYMYRFYNLSLTLTCVRSSSNSLISSLQTGRPCHDEQRADRLESDQSDLAV